MKKPREDNKYTPNDMLNKLLLLLYDYYYSNCNLLLASKFPLEVGIGPLIARAPLLPRCPQTPPPSGISGVIGQGRPGFS